MAKHTHPDEATKRNTRFIVVVSLICILLILLLSILFPSSTGSQTEPTTEATTEEISTSTDPKTGFTKVEGKVYRFEEDGTLHTGWYRINDDVYCFNKDGVLVTGWYIANGHTYYFNEDGILQTNQWVEDRYVGDEGYILKNTITPDGKYVDANGVRNDKVSLATSREGLTELKSNLEDMIEHYSGSWSVYVKDIDSNEYLSINDAQYYSASMIKLFCAAAAYDLIDQGTLEEDETVTRLMREMISVSDNDAFNLMVMKCAPDGSHITGRGVIQEYINENGYSNTTITSILVPTKYKAPSSPGRNSTSAIDCGLLLERIYKGQCVSPEASEKFLNLLLDQTHVGKIPAGLPEGTKCANKTGDTDEVQHDGAIVYSPNGVYILCVMSSGCGSAISNIQTVSKTVYEYFNPEEATTEQIEIQRAEQQTGQIEIQRAEQEAGQTETQETKQIKIQKAD